MISLTITGKSRVDDMKAMIKKDKMEKKNPAINSSKNPPGNSDDPARNQMGISATSSETQPSCSDTPGKDHLSTDSTLDNLNMNKVNFPVNFLQESQTIRQSKTWPVGQRYFEYVQFLSTFPKLISSDRTKLKNKVEEILGYEDFKNLQVKDLNLSKFSGFQILEKYSIEHGISLK